MSHEIRQTLNGILFCNSDNSGTNYNCHVIEVFIQAGNDAKLIAPGDTICLTLIPHQDSTLTFVEIASEEVAPMMHKMNLRHPRDIGGYTLLDLGFWSPGEGRHSMRTVIKDALQRCIDPRDITANGDSKINTRCPNPNHGLREQRELEENLEAFSAYRSVCLFNMVLEKMCTPCLARANEASDDNYGLQEVDLDA